MKTISLTVTNRPALLQRFLASLQTNDLTGYTLFIGLEPVSEECRAICESISFIETEILRNPEVLGINRNPYQLLQHAFQRGSDFNIYLEDDLQVAPDVTRLADWYATLNHDGILDLELCQIYSVPEPHEALTWQRTFLSWGNVFTRRQWEEHFQPQWFGDGTYGWDVNLLHYIQRSPLRSMVPLCSRTRNTGAYGFNSRGDAALLAMGRLALNEKPSPTYRMAERVRLYLEAEPLPEKQAGLEPLLRSYVESSRGASDCTLAQLHLPGTGSRRFVVEQEWSTFAAWEDFHAQTDPRVLAQLAETLAAPVEVRLGAPAGQR